jgi:hypothetical protein
MGSLHSSLVFPLPWWEGIIILTKFIGGIHRIHRILKSTTLIVLLWEWERNPIL